MLTTLFTTLLPYLAAIRSHLTKESGVVAFEYLLLLGGVSVAIILGMAAVPGLITQVIHGTCTAIQGIPSMSGITCP